MEFQSEHNKKIYNQNQNKEEYLQKRNFNDVRESVLNNTAPNQTIPVSSNQYSNFAKGVEIPSLTGNTIKSDEFTHNNMTPFFGSNVKQSLLSNKRILNSYSGSDTYTAKREQETLFNPNNQVENVYGAQDVNGEIQNRFVTSTYRSNELPFDQQRVGKGLNAGYNACGKDGFHQMYRPMPKTIDELRTKSNPKVVYNGRKVPGKNINDKRGLQGRVIKKTPDTAFKQEPNQYLITTGSIIKERQKPTIVLRDTNRKESMEYIASANPNTKESSARSLYRQSDKPCFEASGPRNLHEDNAWTDIDFGDYGLKATHFPPNERDCTTVPTPASNFNSVIRAIVAPVLDVFRYTKKQNAIGNIRETGNIGTSQVSKNIMYDANDIAKTTVKETTIENKRMGQLSGPLKLTTYDPDDIAKRTVRETTADNEYEGTAISYYKKPRVNEAEYRMRNNMVKETTLVGRYPTPQSVKVVNGSDSMNIDVRRQGGQTMNKRRPLKDKIYLNSYEGEGIVTKQKEKYDFTILDEQINPALLTPFKKNPLTQSLNSF